MAVGNKKGLAAVMKAMNSKFGENTISYMGEAKERLKIKRFKSPSVEFNLMLGGGLPVGKIVELYGEAGCGKTSFLLEVIAYQQKRNPDFVAGWFETEQSIDPEDIKMFGIDEDRFVYWDQANVGAEQGFDILRGLVDSGEFDIICVNSVAGLVPSKEVEDDMEKSNIALTARLMSKLFRVVTGSASKNNTTLAFINQVRTDVGKMFGDPSTTTGGKALAFYSSVRIGMSRIKINAGEPITAEQGLKVRCRAVKNRFATGNPFKTCEYYAVYGEGIDTVSELPDVLEREKIVVKSGSWYNWKDEDDNVRVIDGIECKFRSKAVFVENIRKSPTLKAALEKEIDRISTSATAGVDIDEEEIEQIKLINKEIDSIEE